MHEAEKQPVPIEKDPAVAPAASSSVATFVFIALVLAAVLGGAWFMNHGDTLNQAGTTGTESSATGAGAGDTGADKK